MKTFKITIVALIIAMTALGAGCKKKAPQGNQYDSLYDEFSEITLVGHQTGNATYALDGFSLSWQREPHYFDRLGAAMLMVRSDDVNKKLSGVARLALRPSESGVKAPFNYSMGYTSVRSDAIDFFHGEVMDIAMPDGRGSREVEVNLPDAGAYIKPGDAVAVFLRGFYLNADRAKEGDFPVKSFAVRIDNVKVSGNKVGFTAGMEYVTGAKDMYSDSRSRNKIEGKLFYTIAVARGGVVTAGKLETEAMGGAAAKKRVEIAGQAGAFPLAFAGITGFRMEMKGYPAVLKELRFGNSDFNYDAAAGRMAFDCGAWLDRGAGGTDDRMAVSANFVLVQSPDAQGKIKHGSVKGASDGPLAEKKMLSLQTSFKTQPATPVSGSAAPKTPATEKTK